MANVINKSLLGSTIGSKYTYSTGDTSWTTDNLVEFNYMSIYLNVSSVSGTTSTFTFETSNDGGNKFIAVEHSSLTDGVFTIGSATESLKINFNAWNDTHLRITFTSNSETGSLNDLTYLAKSI